MRAVICGGIKYPTIKACAKEKGVGIKRVQYALQVTGALDGCPISYADPDPVYRGKLGRILHSQGEPLLRRGYRTHWLGVHH